MSWLILESVVFISTMDPSWSALNGLPHCSAYMNLLSTIIL